MNTPSQDICPRRSRTHVIACVVLCLVFGGLIAWRCWFHYDRGVRFVPGLHVFGYMFDCAWLFFVFLIESCVLITLHLVRRQRLSELARGVSGITFVLMLIMLLCTFLVFNASFEAGRRHGYLSLDAVSIAEGCESLMQLDSVREKTDDHLYIQEFDVAYETLPEIIRNLKPLDVCVTPKGVILHMDGGGIAAQEGLWVPVGITAREAENIAKKHNMWQLSETPPMYGYRGDGGLCIQ